MQGAYRGILGCLLFVTLVLLHSSCGGSARLSAAPAAGRPSLTELQLKLAAEFARLGIDPGKVAAQAPQGAENAVFDLAATVLDPDGPPDGQGGGNLAPTGIELKWTERLIGDYDQNGEVNISDLSPISASWKVTVSYDDPLLHGGFALWPRGDPTAVGAANWSHARVDGDGNGEINISDITPISVHWKQTLSGYRVYRKAPGASSFSLIDPAGAPDGYTLDHSAPPTPQDPVRYRLTDDEASPAGLGGGVYAYYVAPYDAATDTLGAASGVVYVNNQTGEVNQAPVAALSVTPDFAGAPATITLDASASYDTDGTIAAYRWDFDADGTWDWLSTDPLPEQSSNGTVTGIILGATPGIIIASFNQGSAAWMYPRVAVVDNEAAASNVATAMLGISGWEKELISSTDDSATFNGEELCFNISDLAEDPQTHDLVAAGFVSTTANYADGALVDAVYFARRAAGGGWTQEIAVQPDDPAWHHDFSTYYAGTSILWNTNSQPLLVIAKTVQIGFALEYWSLAAQRSTAGTWGSTFLYGGADGKHGGVAYPVQSEAGRFIAVASDETRKIYLYTYEMGVTALEYTGFDPEEREYQQVHGLALDKDGIPHMMIEDSREDALYRLNYWKRLGPELWEAGHFDENQLTQYDPIHFHFIELAFLSDNTPLCLTARSTEGQEGKTSALSFGAGDALAIRDVREKSGYPEMVVIGDAITVICNSYISLGLYEGIYEAWSDRVEGEDIISERVFLIDDTEGLGAYGGFSGVMTATSEGTVFCVVEEHLPGNIANVYLVQRVDPRL